jgi:hypothetical protein
MHKLGNNDLPLKLRGLLVLLAHTSGLHAAGMLGSVRFRPFSPVWQESSMSAQRFIAHRQRGSAGSNAVMSITAVVARGIAGAIRCDNNLANSPSRFKEIVGGYSSFPE